MGPRVKPWRRLAMHVCLILRNGATWSINHTGLGKARFSKKPSTVERRLLDVWNKAKRIK